MQSLVRFVSSGSVSGLLAPGSVVGRVGSVGGLNSVLNASPSFSSSSSSSSSSSTAAEHTSASGPSAVGAEVSRDDSVPGEATSFSGSSSGSGGNPWAGVDVVAGGAANPAVLDTENLDTLDWSHRYLPNTGESRRAMLAEIGASTITELFHDIPESVRLTERLDLPGPQTEGEIISDMISLASENLNAATTPFFIGGGLYHHSVPSMVDHIIQRSEWMTAYTPYQPEVAQGTLTAMFEFQTQVSILTGLPIANSSMYCGGTSTGEAVLMAVRVGRNKKRKALLAGGLHPQYADIVGTLGNASGRFDVSTQAPDLTNSATDDLIAQIDDNTACVVVQTPDVFGNVVDLKPIAEAAHAKGALLISVVTEAVSLGALETPGSQGADVVTGEGQSFGVPLSMGGPTVGLLACRKEYIRQLPGRIVGQTKDSKGDRAYVLTLGTREQHIRRDKATSNICTSAGLMALGFTAHLTLLGETGLKALAAANHSNACQLADKIEAEVSGVRVMNKTFFNEFTLELPANSNAVNVVDRMANEGVLAGIPYKRLFGEDSDPEHANKMIVACTENVSEHDMTKFVSALHNALPSAL